MTARHVLGGADQPHRADGGLELGQRAHRFDHRGAAAHVELHLVHGRGRLERDAARVKGHRLADQREQGRIASVAVADAVVVEADQPGRLVRSLGHGRECAHALLADRPLTEHRVPEAETVGELLGVRCQRGRGQVVGRRVAQVAGAVLSAGQDRRHAHRLGYVVVGADQQPLHLARVLVWLVALEPVGVQQRAVDQRFDDLVVDVMRNLPAHRGGAQLAGATVRDAGRHARPLGLELVAGAQPDEHEAPALGVGYRQALELPLRLARLEECVQRATGHIVSDALALEHANHDRVGARVEWALSGRLDLHRRSIQVPLGLKLRP